MNGWRPSYLELAPGELERRARHAHEHLGPRCTVCPRLCRVDRREDVKGLCAIGRHAVVASHFPHFGEEDCLRGRRGSGTIFFSGCNLRCVFCLAPDTLIATGAGPRAIGEIFEAARDELRFSDGAVRRPEGVVVMTLAGELAPASKVFSHPYRGELVRVKPGNAPELSLTPNHEVFVADRSAPDDVQKIPAGSLTPHHFLVVPKRLPGRTAVEIDVGALLAQDGSAPLQRRRRQDEGRVLAALASQRSSREVGQELGYHPVYVRRLRSRLRSGTWAVPARRELRREGALVRFSDEHRPGIPARLQLDRPLAWLLGLYCAEGHVRKLPDRPNSYRLIFSFGIHERELASRGAEMLRDAFGVRPQVVSRRTTITVEVGKTSLALLFLGLCGTGSRTKVVPPPVFRASDEIVRAFLDGYLAGDGTTTRTHLVANTVSSRLAHGVYELGLRLNVLPSIHRWEGPATAVIEGRRVRQAPLWYVKLKRDRLGGGDLSRERTRWIDAGTHFLVPIYRIERELYEGDIYNLEVDHPTHSYLAPAVAVANCQNHDISWEVRGERVTPQRLATMMLELQAIGCHNINFVTPENVVPQILEALPLAVDAGLRLPIVYNTSSYDSLGSLHLMEGVVDVYMPDFKLWTSERARRYLKRADYPDVARGTITEMQRQVGDLVLDDRGLARRGVLLRHLVMPGLLDETEAILRWIAEELGTGCYVNLMAQYYVSGKVGKDGEYLEIARGVHPDEYEQALELAEELGLRLDARSRDAGLTLAAR